MQFRPPCSSVFLCFLHPQLRGQHMAVVSALLYTTNVMCITYNYSFPYFPGQDAILLVSMIVVTITIVPADLPTSSVPVQFLLPCTHCYSRKKCSVITHGPIFSYMTLGALAIFHRLPADILKHG